MGKRPSLNRGPAPAPHRVSTFSPALTVCSSALSPGWLLPLAPGPVVAVGLRPAVSGAAVLLPQHSSAARRPAESAAAADAGSWPAAAAAAAAAAAVVAGRSSVSAAVESLLGTPRGTGQLLVAGLRGVLPETKQGERQESRR